MLRDDFGYAGPNAAAKEFVDTVNQMAKLLNGMGIEFNNESGGKDVTRINQTQGGLKIDLTRLVIPPTGP